MAALLGAVTLMVSRIPSRLSPQLPSIDFVHYKDKTGGAVAVFQVNNRSGRSFSYFGSASTHPGYLYNIPHHGEWFPQPPEGLDITLPSVSEWQHLPPHGSFEFDVPVRSVKNPQLRSALSDVPPSPSNATFTVGLFFSSGTPTWAQYKEKVRYTPYLGDFLDSLFPEWPNLDKPVLSKPAPPL